MAHAHTRTLIAKLGFADPDRKEPLHDLACRYLAEPEQTKRLCDRFVKPTVAKGLSPESDPRTLRFQTQSAQLEVALSKGADKYKTTIGFLDVVATFRAKAHRGRPRDDEPKANFNIAPMSGAPGFDEAKQMIEAHRAALLDPKLLAAKEAWAQQREATDAEWLRGIENSPDGWNSIYSSGYSSEPYAVCVEVKIQPVGYAELLRQINLYREYWENPATWWVAAIRFDAPQTYVDVLHRERVEVVRLGSAFDAWVAQQAKDVTPAKLEDF